MGDERAAKIFVCRRFIHRRSSESREDGCHSYARASNAAIILYIACVRTMSTRMLDLKDALPPRR